MSTPNYEIVKTSTERAKDEKFSVRRQGHHLGAITARNGGYFVWKDRTGHPTVAAAAAHIITLVDDKDRDGSELGRFCRPARALAPRRRTRYRHRLVQRTKGRKQ